MNQEDINEIVQLLVNAIRNQDWDNVEEALDYLRDFQDEPFYDDEE
jgi:hypothetical protein